MGFGKILYGRKSSKGDALPENVLSGKTFSNQDQVGITGGMPNLQNGNVYCGAEGVKSFQIYPENAAYAQLKISPSPNQKPKGFCDETTTFETHLSGLLPQNIKKGVTIADKMAGTLDYDGMVAERDAQYNNYITMLNDRNNWMNIANSRKQFITGSFVRSPGDIKTDTVSNLPFVPSLVFASFVFYGVSINGYNGDAMGVASNVRPWYIDKRSTSVTVDINGNSFNFSTTKGDSFSDRTIYWWAFS